MRSLFLLVMLSSVCISAPPITVRPNIHGGYTYNRGTTVITQSRPNVHGGYTYQGRVNGYSRSTIMGQQFYVRNR